MPTLELPAEAFCESTSAAVVLSAANVPAALVDQATSAAGLAYVVPVNVAVAALICTLYGRFDLTVNVGPVVGIWTVVPELKSLVLEGAARVIDVPDVKPAIVSESSDGIVSECVDVIVHGLGLAAVELMEHVCARTGCATSAIAPATTPARRTNLECMMTPVNGLAASLTRCREASHDNTILRDHVLCSGVCLLRSASAPHCVVRQPADRGIRPERTRAR